jgi:hypothetical protein
MDGKMTDSRDWTSFVGIPFKKTDRRGEIILNFRF